MPHSTDKSADRRGMMRRVLARLERAYGRRPCQGADDPVDTLIWTILSQSTSDANSAAGFERLKAAFPTWKVAADAPVARIQRCIRICGLSRTKAPRIRRILRQVRAERGRIDLSFLGEMAPPAAAEYLMGLHGVGPKTALCVLLFAFGRPVFPVDTHIYRIALRLGLLTPRTPQARAHEVLTPMIAPADRYATHILLIAHGRAICRARRPQCDRCTLLEFCRFGKAGLGRQRL